MREKLYDVLKGIIIGIGNILPGFSGGVMAVSFGVYDRLIQALTNFFKKPIKVFKDIWALAIGVAIGILITIIGIFFLLENFPIPTTFFFTGLIIGSVPNIYTKTKSEDNQKIIKKVLAFILGFSLIIIISLLPSKDNIVATELDFKQLFILFAIGLLAAATMIIPGVSGSLILLAIGYYQYILDFIMEFLRSILELNKDVFLPNLALIIALGLGIVIGLFSLAKVVEKLLKLYPKVFYSAVLGLLLASPFAIITEVYSKYQVEIEEALVLNWVFGILFLIIGVFASIYIIKSENKIEEKEVN